MAKTATNEAKCKSGQGWGLGGVGLVEADHAKARLHSIRIPSDSV